MRKILALLTLCLLIPLAAQADVIVGGSGSATYVFKDGDVFRAPELVAEIEWQTNVDEEAVHWLGLVGRYGITEDEGPGELIGLGLRYYMHVSNFYPGLGIGGFALQEKESLISETTMVIGPELLLEIPYSDGDQILGFFGWYPSVVGDEITVARFGIRAAFN